MDRHRFTVAYNSVKRFVGKLRQREPEQFDRLAFLPSEEMQVDYGEGARTRVPGTDRWRKPRLFVATLRYSRRSYRCVVWRSSQEAVLIQKVRRHPFAAGASGGNMGGNLSAPAGVAPRGA